MSATERDRLARRDYQAGGAHDLPSAPVADSYRQRHTIVRLTDALAEDHPWGVRVPCRRCDSPSALLATVGGMREDQSVTQDTITQEQSDAVAASALAFDPTSVGQKAGEVVIAIDYAIIQHFSQHLYGSPNKAIEELVANGYDALARRVDVWVPGPEVADCVLVWDDGKSMDASGLKQLWEIARSPKSKVPNRRVTGTVGGNQITRDMIGKFGIGKLASYAVGDEITHFCRRGGEEHLVVTVDYPTVLDEDRKAGEEYKADVLRLTADEMAAQVRSLFSHPPASLDALLARPTWTLARIGRLREGVDLKPGRLRWVIGNGMPLQPDFTVVVNSAEVESKLAAAAKQTWNLGDLELCRAVAAAWQDAVQKNKADGTLLIGPSMSGALPPAPKSGDTTVWVQTSEEIPDRTIRYPHLGDVEATVRLYESSLLAKEGEDRPRTHGFFVMVRGRLINSEDDKLFLNDPSFTTFYRTQFQIKADRLDSELLADRERIRTTTPAAAELTQLQVGLNRAARGYFDRLDDAIATNANPVSLLPLDSRELFRQPLTALLLAKDELTADGADFRTPAVTRGNYTEQRPLSDVDAKNGRFVVNEDHPLFQAVRKQAPGGAAGQRFFRIFDVFAVAERLMEGHLYDIGTPPETVEAIIGWRDQLLRALANRYSLAGEEVLAEVQQASYKGDKAFEKALAKLFNLMGFTATRDGASGKKDILTIAPVGPEHYSFVVEAKGSQKAIANDDADISSAAAHRDAAGADHAIVVAREFAGFAKDNPDGPAVLKECTSTGEVSIVTLDVLADLYQAVQQFSYPLSVILPVLREVEPPAAKKQRVAALADPLDKFDYRGTLDAIWAQQHEKAKGDVVAWRPLWQEKRIGTAEQFASRLIALEHLSGGLVKVNTTNETVVLVQSPDQITQRITNAVSGALLTAADDPSAVES